MDVNVINRTRSLVNPLRVKNCERFLCRLKGLMFQNSIETDSGLLMIHATESLANALMTETNTQERNIPFESINNIN